MIMSHTMSLLPFKQHGRQCSRTVAVTVGAFQVWLDFYIKMEKEIRLCLFDTNKTVIHKETQSLNQGLKLSTSLFIFH